MTLNVYSRYYEADACFSGVKPPDDFAVSYDAYFEKELYRAAGRRSRKREAALLASLPEEVDALAKEHDARIDWSRPLSEAKLA